MATARISVLNRSRGTEVAAEVLVARRLWERAQGLLARPRLRPGEGLLLWPCSSVHTFFMAYPLDLVFLDSEWRVLRSIEALRPFHFAVGPKGTESVLELPAGTVSASNTQLGDSLAIVL